MPIKHPMMLSRRNSSPRGVSQLSDADNDTTLSNDDAIMTSKEQPSSLAVTGIPQQKKEHLLSILKRPDDSSSPAPSYSQRGGIAITSPTSSLKSTDACGLALNTDTDTAMFIAAYTNADVVSAYTDEDDDTDTERFDLKKNGCVPKAPIKLGSNRKGGGRLKQNTTRMTSKSKNLLDNEANRDYDTPLCGLTYACISLLRNEADHKEKERSRNESIDDSSLVGSDSSAKSKSSFPLLEADLARYAATSSTFKVDDNDGESSGVLSILGLYSTRNVQQSERNESSIVDDDHHSKVDSKCVDKMQRSKAIIAGDFSWKSSKSIRKAKSNPINQIMLASLVGTASAAAAAAAADAAPTISSQEDGLSKQILDHEKGESHIRSGLINNLLTSMAALSCYNVDDTKDTRILNTGIDDNHQSQPIVSCVETSTPQLDEVVPERSKSEESYPLSVRSTLASGTALVSTRLESQNDMAINDDDTRLDEGEEVLYGSAVRRPDGSVNCHKSKEQKGGLTIVVYDSKESGRESKNIIMQSVIPSVIGHKVGINEEEEQIEPLMQNNEMNLHQGQEENGDGIAINPTADVSLIAVTADAASAEKNECTSEFRECDGAINEHKVDDCINKLASIDPSNENHDVDKSCCSWGAITIDTCTVSNSALRKHSDVMTDAPWDETENNGALWNPVQNDNIPEEREMLTCNTAAWKYILKDIGIRLFDDNGKKEKGTTEVKEEDLTAQQVEIKEATDFLSINNTALVTSAALISPATLVESTANDNDEAQVDDIEVSNDDLKGDESCPTIHANSRKAVEVEAFTTVKTHKSSRWTNSPKTPKSRSNNVPTKKAKRWRAFVDFNTGKTYYSNGLITTWKHPVNCEILPPSIPTSTPWLRTESRVSSANSLETPVTSNRVAFTIPKSLLPPVIDNDASLHEEEGEEVAYSSVRIAGKNVM